MNIDLNTVRGVSNRRVNPEPSLAQGSDKRPTSFGSIVESLLGEKKGHISEEELFAGVIQERLQSLSSGAAEFYSREKARIAKEKTRADGYVPLEDVAKEALRSTIEAGMITQQQGGKVFSESFAAAQLDNNKEALYDGRGGPNDPTIATAPLDQAFSSMKEMLRKIDRGEAIIALRPLLPQNNEKVEGGVQQLDGSGGFVWKPVSDSDGKLAVLLPSKYAELLDRVEVHSKNPPDETSKVDGGRFAGNTNGNRPTFRFERPGAEYGDNLFLVAYPKLGEPLIYSIPKGGERQD